MSAHVSLTYLPTFRLLAHAPSLPHLPTHPPICLLAHQPTYLCIYALNLHQGNEGVAIYQVGCFVLLLTYLPTRSYNFVIVENKVAMTQSNVLQLNLFFFFFVALYNSIIKSHMKILQMNLICLLKPHQSTDVTILAIPSLNFLTIIKFQTCAIPLAQFTNIYIYK